jgi:hypothetical protein
VLLGGQRSPELVDQDQAGLIRTARAGLEQTMGITQDADVTFVKRWDRGIPSYAPGHIANVKAIFERVDAIPGLYLNCNAYRGIAMNDCAREKWGAKIPKNLKTPFRDGGEKETPGYGPGTIFITFKTEEKNGRPGLVDQSMKVDRGDFYGIENFVLNDEPVKAEIEEKVDQDQERVVLDPGEFQNLQHTWGVHQGLITWDVNDETEVYVAQ